MFGRPGSNGTTGPDLRIHGFPPEVPEQIAAVERSRILRSMERLLAVTGKPELTLTVRDESHPVAQSRARPSPAPTPIRRRAEDESSLEQRAAAFKAQAPHHSFAQLVLPSSTLEEILAAVDLINLVPKVFGEWGLAAVEPFPRTALNFYGPPGTGKTLAAHAVADRLGRPLLSASCANIESMYVGDGPKNIEALFAAAERDGAVLFVDEADSLLSRRLSSVTQGAEQAFNSLRSQLLLSLQTYQGVVIFATNLVESYDPAFETRVRSIRFELPDEPARAAIWRAHLPTSLPLAPDVSARALAAHADGVCGRDIKNAVIDAAVRAARRGAAQVSFADLAGAVDRIKAARAIIPVGEPLSGEERAAAAQKLREALAAGDA